MQISKHIWFNGTDTAYISLRENILSVTMVDFYSGTRSGPIWAIQTVDNDTVIVRVVDASTKFYLDICTSYNTFQLAVEAKQDTLLFKLNGKLYKIKNLVTSLETSTEEPSETSTIVSQKVLYIANIKGKTGNLSVSNIEGRRLISLDYLPESVSLQNLKSGIYLVTLTDGDTSVRKKIFIE